MGSGMKRLACALSLSLCAVGPVWAIDPPLGAYAIDIHQTSVSGVSSGGAMAVQMHVAHSSIMRGVGVIAGVTYDCADSGLTSVTLSKGRGFLCMDGSTDYSAASIGRTDAAAAHGYIDSTQNLAGQNVWLFSGYNDGLVRRGAMNAVAKYYSHYQSNVFYKINNHAPHALLSNETNNPCLGANHDFMNNCSYDAAGLLLQHIYGRLDAPGATLTSSVQKFDQREFQDPSVAGRIGLADTGYVYIPEACKTATCRVHVVFHGCLQYADRVGDVIYEKGGYNKWADTNKIIVLYPQTEPIGTFPGVDDNPTGCWDWWGLSETLPKNREFARKTGYQISAIRKMLDRLAQGPAHSGASSNTFGKPGNVSAKDSSSRYIALIWRPNSAAKTFNVYRSTASSGPYTKIGTVSGASFGDKNLTPNTTYYYKISSVDASNQESAKTSPVHKKTLREPPACDPYFGDNITLVAEGRAYTPNLIVTFAVGSNDFLGAYSFEVFSELIKDDTIPWPFYNSRYCP